MHMWWWFGYNMGEFMFPGLEIKTTGSFAALWIVLFVVAFLFEASKVYLARVQREAPFRIYACRSDERRNLLNVDPTGNMEPTTSRNNNNSGQVSTWASFPTKVAVNLHQSAVFVVHNVVGYLLMLAVMMYNVQLLLAVVLGMMLGYFLFGTKLTRLQMKCFGTKRVICTPECDYTAESTTPPLIDSSTESDVFICQTRTCIQPSHYFRASTSQEGTASDQSNATCYYGAKKCPSKVARAKKLQEIPSTSHYHHGESEKEDSPSVEDAQLLRTERQGCCKKKQEPPPVEEKKCCKSSQIEVQVAIHEATSSCCNKEEVQILPEVEDREDSPQITCCNKVKPVLAESQEQIMN